MKVTKETLLEVKLSKEECEQYHKILLEVLNDYPYKKEKRSFVYRLVNRLFKNATTINEKAYYYRFSLINQLKRNQEDVNVRDIVYDYNPQVYKLCREMNIDINSLKQYMSFPDENTDVTMYILDNG